MPEAFLLQTLALGMERSLEWGHGSIVPNTRKAK